MNLRYLGVLDFGLRIVGLCICADDGCIGEILMVDYLKESGVPRTSLYTGFYIENFLNPVMAPKKQEDGSYLLPFPTLPDGNPSKVSKIPTTMPPPTSSPPMPLPHPNPLQESNMQPKTSSTPSPTQEPGSAPHSRIPKNGSIKICALQRNGFRLVISRRSRRR